MAYTPETKSKGNLILSQDWNDTTSEVVRLETAKVDRGGDTVNGSLTINGNLGVGTASPQTKLHIEGGTDATPTTGGYLILGSIAGVNLTLDKNEIMARNSGSKSTLYLQNVGGDLVVHTDKFVVKDNGNVGVGTAGPDAKLHLTRLNSGTTPLLKLGNRNQSTSEWSFDVNGSAQLSLNNGGNGSPTTALSIESNGNIGIGKTPTAKLDIDGNVAISDALSVSGTASITGNVGIGISTPDQTLHVHKGSAGNVSASQYSVAVFENNSHAYLNILSPSDSYSAVLFGDEDDRDVGYISYHHDSDELLLGAGGQSRVQIDGNGNVAISNALSVSGTAYINGNVGINRSDRLSKLTVKGTAGYQTGSVSTTNGSTTVTGSGTAFSSQVGLGDRIWISGADRTVTAIVSDTELTVNEAWTTSNSGVSWWVWKSLFRGDYYSGDGAPRFIVDYYGKIGIGTIDLGNDHLDVRGRCYSSGGWQTTDADYAEYFESEDKTAIRVGTSVTLADNGKIRRAKKGDAPIGIVTLNSAFVGNSYKEWPGKYLRDEFGNLVTKKKKIEMMVPKTEKVKKQRQRLEKKTITEEVSRDEVMLKGKKYIKKTVTEKVKREVEDPVFKEVDLYDETGKNKIGKHMVPVMEEYEEEIEITDKNGDIVMVGSGEFDTEEQPQLNPDYDETQEYIPREKRPEWHCVGLLGQLEMRKGQPVADNWIRIKTVSDKVELWLVK